MDKLENEDIPFGAKNRQELFDAVLERWATPQCPLRSSQRDTDLFDKLTSGARPWPNSEDREKSKRNTFYFEFVVSCIGDKSPYSLPACRECKVGYWNPKVRNTESI